MYKPIVLFLLTASAAIVADSSPQLLRRQVISQLPCSAQGEKDCGALCIPLSYTCCPDGSGGCPVGSYCSLGSNGQYGCCQNGRTCAGPGGASTAPGRTITSTQTIPVSSSTSISVSTYSPPSVSHSSTLPSNFTTTNPTVTTSPAVFTGAADSNLRAFSPVNLLAFVLAFLAA